MKKIILFAAAAALFAACASDELQTQTQQQTAQDDGAIMFDAYMQRSVTRAGAAGELKLDAGTTQLKTTGFGVFGYYTDNFDYSPLYLPNFMYNEEVTWNSETGHEAFEYKVTKYWPNEHGDKAQSADQDRVSFFAYAPYVNVDPATGMVIKSGTTPYDPSEPEVQWGITGMKRNTLQGDPLIQYIASFDQNKSVDLCWGTVGTSQGWATNGGSGTMPEGYPWLNVRKPDGVAKGANSTVKFDFQHATAKLLVDVKTDNNDDWITTDAATHTKVWIRSVRFTGMTQKAALNLNNPKTITKNKARWISYYGSTELEMGESVTVHDGRKDGAEGVEGAVAPNETVLGINPQLIQDHYQLIEKAAWRSTGEGLVRTGVKSADYVPLFCKGNAAADADAPIFVIPTGERVDVEIVYDVETIDPKLPTFLSDGVTHGSTIENRIKKENVLSAVGSSLVNGKAYTLHLILGMKDVKVNATVADWSAEAAQNVELPKNN